MDAMLSRPHRRPRRNRKQNLALGGPGNPADFVVAMWNVEAEVLCVNGHRLKDSRGCELPTIIDKYMPSRERDLLLEAVRVMHVLAEPKFGIQVTQPFLVPTQRSWDLDSLEEVFVKASGFLALAAEEAMRYVDDETLPFECRTEAIDPGSRIVCLWSSILYLAGECTFLKIRYQRIARRSARFGRTPRYLPSSTPS